MQRTLKREFKELEIVKRETIEVSYPTAAEEIQLAWLGFRAAPVVSGSALGIRCVVRLSLVGRVHFSSVYFFLRASVGFPRHRTPSFMGR